MGKMQSLRKQIRKQTNNLICYIKGESSRNIL